MNQFMACKELGVNYYLFTAFPFVEKMVFGKGKAPIMPLKWMQNPAIDIPTIIAQSCRHTIQDSGLFTLMFGARKNLVVDSALIHKWYDNLVQFTLDHGQPVTCVEVDCQNLLGMEKVWELRHQMRQDLPNHRVINVFHMNDGIKELDRLIEFSDYIAFSVPEMRAKGKADYVSKLTRYVKHRKPTIDIHLLGCTATKLLRENIFCTSCDSTTYTVPKRFGYLGGRHIRNISQQAIINHFGEEHFNSVAEYNNEQNTCTLLLTIEHCKQEYQKAGGNQDYIK
ncbi:MAG: hypothetical protein NC548_32170 [Lachnospiraceae bacterium]|nr:hypothetical protein [Lachnospiraceae bacterium]